MNIPEGMTVEQYVIDLAAKHGVVYQKTYGDQLAEVFTRLSDDEVEQDDICDLLIALDRNGVLTKGNGEWMDLLQAYLREKFHGEPYKPD